MNQEMETVNWKIEGMTCSNCALTISKYLQHEGVSNVKVNPIDGDVSFETPGEEKAHKLIKGIEGLGYKVVDSRTTAMGGAEKRPMNKFLRYFLICLPFTLILMLHMLERWINLHWLMNPWLQLGLCIPVYVIGMNYFGKSAVRSLMNGMPNMNVL